MASLSRLLWCFYNCEPDNVRPMATLASQLGAKGFEPYGLLGWAQVCNGRTYPPGDPLEWKCTGCQEDVKTILSELGIRFGELPYPKQLPEVDFDWNPPYLPGQGPACFFRDYDLWGISKASIFRMVQRTALEPSDREIVGWFYQHTRAAIQKCERLLDSHSFGGIVVFQGMPVFDRVLVEVSRRVGIPAFAYENTSFQNRKFFVPGGFVVNRHPLSRDEYWQPFRGRALTAGQESGLDSILQSTFAGSSQIWQPKNHSRGGRSISGLLLDRPFVLVLGQVPCDSVITHDSPHYPTTVAFFLDLIDRFTNELSAFNLVIRFHPLEARIFGSSSFHRLSQLDLPDNVWLIDGSSVNTYVLMDYCHTGVVINSQTGLELVAKGRRPLICGTAFYGGKGFTRDLKSRGDLSAALRDICARPRLSDEETVAARRFLYHLLFEYVLVWDDENKAFTETSADRARSFLPALEHYDPKPPGSFLDLPCQETELHRLRQAMREPMCKTGLQSLVSFGAIAESREWRLAKIDVLQVVGKTSEAFANAKELVEKRPGDLDVLRRLLDCSYLCPQDRRLIPEAASLIPIHVRARPEAQLALGLAASIRGDLDEAKTRFFHVLNSLPQDPLVRLEVFRLSRRFWDVARYVDARGCFEKIAEMPAVPIPGHLYPHYVAMFRESFRRKMPLQMPGILDFAQRSIPGSRRLNRYLVVFHLRIGKWRRALRQAVELIKLYVSDIDGSRPPGHRGNVR